MALTRRRKRSKLLSMEKKAYRPPLLKIILNGPPKDISSNVDRLTMVSIAVITTVMSIGLMGLKREVASLLLVPYTLEALRQATLVYKKCIKNN